MQRPSRRRARPRRRTAARRARLTPLPFAAERGSGSRALVFLHGIGGDHRAFDSEVERFGRSCRALAWDMPGYGQSPPAPSLTFPVLAEALAGLLDARGIERAILVGHSMGGMVAQELAASRPDRVAALVLVATSPAFGSLDGEMQKRFLAERLKPIDEGKTPADIAPTVVRNLVGENPDPRGVARAIECMSGISPETYRAALHCLVAFDRRASLAAIRCPALAIAGERDRVVAPDVVERMALAIPGAVFHTITGCGHLTNLERPDEFGRSLEDFLDALP